MAHYTGPERRAVRDNGALDERIERIEKTLACMRRTSEEFVGAYGDILRELLEARARRARLWGAATERLVTGGIWAALVFLGLATWEWLKTHLTKGAGP